MCFTRVVTTLKFVVVLIICFMLLCSVSYFMLVVPYDSLSMLLHMELDQGGGRSVDLGGFFANADANYLGREQSEGNYNASNIQNAVVDIDPMDMSESMQEAMHRSNMDMRYK